MAIHPEHPGLSAEIVINDEALPEYSDEEVNEDRSPETFTTYAQVDSNAHFGVRYTIPQHLTGDCGVRSQLLLDGQNMCAYIHPRQDFGQGDVTNCLDERYTTRDGSNYVQRFRFAQLQIDEDAEAKRDEHTPRQLKAIGRVTLKLCFINSVTKRERTPEPPEGAGAVQQEKLPSLGQVAEKCFKGDAKSHQASLDTPVFAGRSASRRSKTRTINNCGKPFAIFHFKYRSLAALKSLHIVERTPSPSPAPPAQRRVEDMTREELEAIARNSQMKAEPGAPIAKREGRSKIKREAGADDSDGEVEFVSRKRKKAVSSRRDEVIILD